MAEAYWNLHRGRWSLRHDGGRVYYRLPVLTLVDVTLVVRAAGVRRIRERGQREVVAWARGVHGAGRRGGRPATRIRFRPFLRPDFHTDDGVTVVGCDLLYLELDGSAWGIGCR